jgi:hypothetical protein
MLLRPLACVFAALALIAAAPAPAPPSAGSATDHVDALAGVWSCRSAEGALTRSTGLRDGDTVKVRHVVDRDGKRSSFEDRYTFDSAQQRWHVVSGLGGFKADGPAWLAGAWTIQGVDVNTVARRMTLELLPSGDFRRTLSYENGANVFATESVELCTPGTTPPRADACIADRYPATTLEAAPVDGRFIPRNGPLGTVVVIVSLNERSEVVGARVQSSPNAAYDGPALAAVRASKFRTEIRNCKPVAADYAFGVTFEP